MDPVAPLQRRVGGAGAHVVEDTAEALDGPPRGDVVVVAGDEDAPDALGARYDERLAQDFVCVATAAVRGPYGVADVAAEGR